MQLPLDAHLVSRTASKGNLYNLLEIHGNPELACCQVWTVQPGSPSFLMPFQVPR